MQFLIELIYPLASTLNLPTELLILTALIMSGLMGHFLIHHFVRRLSLVADRTNTRWDDVLVYSISPPAEWAMWVVLGLEVQESTLHNKAALRPRGAGLKSCTQETGASTAVARFTDEKVTASSAASVAAASSGASA